MFQAATLVSEAPVENGLRLLAQEWKDRDRDYVRMLASRTAAAGPATAVIFSATEVEPVRVFLARSPDLQFDCGRMLREALAQFGLRGGGSSDLAQGDVPAGQQRELLASLTNSIRDFVSKSRT